MPAATCLKYRQPHVIFQHESAWSQCGLNVIAVLNSNFQAEVDAMGSKVYRCDPFWFFFSGVWSKVKLSRRHIQDAAVSITSIMLTKTWWELMSINVECLCDNWGRHVKVYEFSCSRSCNFYETINVKINSIFSLVPVSLFL